MKVFAIIGVLALSALIALIAYGVLELYDAYRDYKKEKEVFVYNLMTNGVDKDNAIQIYHEAVDEVSKLVEDFDRDIELLVRLRTVKLDQDIKKVMKRGA